MCAIQKSSLFHRPTPTVPHHIGHFDAMCIHSFELPFLTPGAYLCTPNKLTVVRSTSEFKRAYAFAPFVSSLALRKAIHKRRDLFLLRHADKCVFYKDKNEIAL